MFDNISNGKWESTKNSTYNFFFLCRFFYIYRFLFSSFSFHFPRRHRWCRFCRCLRLPSAALLSTISFSRFQHSAILYGIFYGVPLFSGSLMTQKEKSKEANKKTCNEYFHRWSAYVVYKVIEMGRMSFDESSANSYHRLLQPKSKRIHFISASSSSHAFAMKDSLMIIASRMCRFWFSFAFFFISVSFRPLVVAVAVCHTRMVKSGNESTNGMIF